MTVERSDLVNAVELMMIGTTERKSKRTCMLVRTDPVLT
jgi:hypothetical protein